VASTAPAKAKAPTTDYAYNEAFFRDDDRTQRSLPGAHEIDLKRLSREKGSKRTGSKKRGKSRMKAR